MTDTPRMTARQIAEKFVDPTHSAVHRDRYVDECEAAIESLLNEREVAAALKAVREDRRANAEFWKSNIDKMFDNEIATYSELLDRLKKATE